MLRRMLALLMTLCLLTLCAAAPAEEADGPLTIELLIDTEGVRSVYYTCYLEGKQVMMGAAADLDGADLEPSRVLTIELLPVMLEGEGAPDSFSIDFSPFDGESPVELGRTQQVAFPLEAGATVRIRLTGSPEQGYVAIPEWEEELPGFTLLLDNDSDADPAYLRIDYYHGEEPLGYVCVCPDEGETVFRVRFDETMLESIEPEYLAELRLEVSIAWDEVQGIAALEKVLQGEPGEEQWIGTLQLQPVPGATYAWRVVGTAEKGYRVEEK